jgi:RND superfamily putative drug exporter
VLFAGSIVVVALLGLMTMGIPFVGALGLAAAIVVALAVAVALTLLPALLTLIGHRIDRWGFFGRNMAAATEPGGRWERVADAMQRHPWRAVVASLVIMLALAAPALDMRIGSSDAGNSPTTLTSRRAYDLVTEGFGPGYNGPLTIVVDMADATDPTVVDTLIAELEATSGVAHVSTPMSNQQASSPQANVAIISVVPETSPQDKATQDLVYILRDDVIAPTLDGSGAEAHVGGPTAAYIDMADRIAERLPIFFAVVIGLSAVLLMIVFRSVVVPLQAAIMNLLAIGAAYGVLVAIFQWGWFSDVFGVDRTGPIESFLPMMLFGILFGLSTDYEVFLVSRMHETWLKTRDSRRAVNEGSASTMRVITAAASIMVMVFLSFTLSDVRIVKEFGLGLAVAVFLYATVIRLMLAPAMMALFGQWNWYMPAWMDRRLPRLSIEGPAEEAVAPSAAAD